MLPMLLLERSSTCSAGGCLSCKLRRRSWKVLDVPGVTPPKPHLLPSASTPNAVIGGRPAVGFSGAGPGRISRDSRQQRVRLPGPCGGCSHRWWGLLRARCAGGTRLRDVAGPPDTDRNTPEVDGLVPLRRAGGHSHGLRQLHLLVGCHRRALGGNAAPGQPRPSLRATRGQSCWSSFKGQVGLFFNPSRATHPSRLVPFHRSDPQRCPSALGTTRNSSIISRAAVSAASGQSRCRVREGHCMDFNRKWCNLHRPKRRR